MPGFNGTGPDGQGPRTGRMRGYCKDADMAGEARPKDAPGYGQPGMGAGMGMGRGMGRGQGCGMGRGMGRGMGCGTGQGMGRGMGRGTGQGMGRGMGRGMGPGGVAYADPDSASDPEVLKQTIAALQQRLDRLEKQDDE